MNISTTISGGNILLNRLYGLVDSFNKEGLKNIAYMSAGVLMIHTWQRWRWRWYLVRTVTSPPAVPVQPAGWEHKVKIKRPWLALAPWRSAARPAGRWWKWVLLFIWYGTLHCALLGAMLCTYTTPCCGGGLWNSYSFMQLFFMVLNICLDYSTQGI